MDETELTPLQWAKVFHGEAAVGYVAGILDGEGSIGAYFVTGRDGWERLIVRINITSVNKEVLEFCQKIIGGYIASYQPKQRDGYNRRKLYQLRIGSLTGIKNALLIMRPYLIIKKKAAGLMFELIENREKRFGTRYAPEDVKIVGEIHRINKGGI